MHTPQKINERTSPTECNKCELLFLRLGSGDIPHLRTGPVIAHSSLPGPTDDVHARTVSANIHVATLAIDEPRSASRTALQESIGLVPA